MTVATNPLPCRNSIFLLALLLVTVGATFDTAPTSDLGDPGDAGDCPIGAISPAVANIPVCGVQLPSPVYVREFPNAANLTQFNCLNPTAPFFLAATKDCTTFITGSGTW